MANGVEKCKALAARLGAPVVNSYLQNESFPASHPLWCVPPGYQGSKVAMKLIAQADVVVLPGSRLGPVGTLPQHAMDYLGIAWRPAPLLFSERSRPSVAATASAKNRDKK